MKKKLFLVPLFVLSACSTSTIPSNNSVNPSSFSQDDSFSSTTSRENESVSSTNTSSSKRGGISIIVSNSSTSSSSNNSSTDPNVLNYAQVENLLVEAIKHDEECTQLDLTTYDIVLNNYVKTEGTAKKYSNDIDYITGEKTYSDFLTGNKIKSNFVQQKMFKNGVYSDILKHDASFINEAHKEAMDSSKAKKRLSLGQGEQALSCYSSLKTNKQKFLDSKKTDTGYYISLEYYGDMDDNGYTIAGGIELTLDEHYYIQDFFYTEGTYDWMYIDSVKTMRRHGPAPYGDGGVIYEITHFQYNDNATYSDPIKFPLEENFVKSISFKTTEITLKKSDNYVDLYNYIVTDPIGGETSGCPYNNLTFTSSNSTVASVDRHYLDLNKVGETVITVKDKVTNATSTNTLKVIVE